MCTANFLFEMIMNNAPVVIFTASTFIVEVGMKFVRR